MPESRNILFLQSSSEHYGSGKIILQVLQVYQREGFRPIVLLTGPGPVEENLKEEGIVYYVQNLGILRRKYVNPLGLVNRLSKNLKAYRFLSQLHMEYQFELVYSNTLAVIVGAYWARRNKIPHIWHIHEIIPGPSSLVKLLSRLLDISSSKPISVSQAVANHWQPYLKKSSLEIIHNGIAYDDFLKTFPDAKKEISIPESSICIGMIGRINPGKGQLFFLQMAEKLAKKYSSVHFILVGDPFTGYESILEEIKKEIKDKKLEKRVSYLGFRKDIPRVLAAIDIFVLPSILPDSFPTVILEAMAAGKPVVATLSGGSAEMVEDGVTGFLIPIGDVSKEVAAIGKLIENPNLRSQMGEAGRVRVLKEFSLESFEEKIKNHLWQHLTKD